jgi:hypothetical protein
LFQRVGNLGVKKALKVCQSKDMHPRHKDRPFQNVQRKDEDGPNMTIGGMQGCKICNGRQRFRNVCAILITGGSQRGLP